MSSADRARRDWRALRIGAPLLVAVPLLFLGLFFYYPLTRILAQAFHLPGSPSAADFAALFASRYVRHVMLFSVVQALESTAASVAIGLPLAYLLATREFPGRRLLKSLTVVPFALPAVTVALGFIIAYGNNGALNRAIAALFGLHHPLPILYSIQGIVLAHAFYNAPIVARFVAASWERLPRVYEEAARSVGAPRRAVFFDVTLPMLLPSLLSGATLAFIYSFLSFPIVLAIGGARFSTIEVEIYLRAIVQIDPASAAALASVELVVALVFTLGYLALERRYLRSVGSAPPRGVRPLFPTLRSALDPRRLAAALFLLFVAVFLAAPIVAVVVDSFTRHTDRGGSFTLAWYGEVLRPRYSSLIAASPLQSIVNSVLFAAATMALAVALGTILAFLLARPRKRTLLETLVMAPVGASPVAFGLAMLWAFARPPLHLSGSAAAIILAHTVLATPFVVRAVRPVIARVSGSLTEAARSLGATPVRAALDVVVPLARAAIVSAAAFAFAVSVAETSATIMLSKPNLLTMPVAIYYLMAGRQFGGASAMAVVFMVVVALSFIVIDRFGELRPRRPR